MPSLIPSRHEHLFNARDAARAAKTELLQKLQSQPATQHDVIMHREHDQAEAAASGALQTHRQQSLDRLRQGRQILDGMMQQQGAGIATLFCYVVGELLQAADRINHAQNFPAARLGLT